MNIAKEADVVVIGGGIAGCAILRELSKYDLHCVLVEKEPDLACGTTKANSAILHAGFDAPLGSAKARTNVAGNALYHKLQKELDLEIKWTGSLVVATNEDEMQVLKQLLERGQKNGVPGLELLSKEQVLAKEPNLQTAIGALWAPTAGVCWPFQAALAFAQCAVQNGAEVLRNCKVEGFIKENNKIIAVNTSLGTIKTNCVINAAGLFADEIAALAGLTDFKIHPRKGEYILFDKKAAKDLVSGIVFPTPSAVSKGILICTTAHGNTFIGPNANDIESPVDTSVTTSGMDQIIASACKLIPKMPLGAAITEFAGLRAVADSGDFVIGATAVSGFFNAAGLQSPGLSAAPAIAQEVVAAIKEYLPLQEKAEFKADLPRRIEFAALSDKDKASVIANNNLYGRVICRCETVTEGEIVAAIKAPCGALTVDAVKRRTRAGMGRCQGGFCGPRVTQILARELGIDVAEVLKEHQNSQMFYKKSAGEVDEQ